MNTEPKAAGLCRCSVPGHHKAQCYNFPTGSDGFCDACRTLAAKIAVEKAVRKVSLFPA